MPQWLEDMSSAARPGDVPFDFFRCKKCGRLCTALEMRGALGFNPDRCCPCGSLSYAPQNMRWYHWGLPRVWSFAVARMRGQA